MLTIRETRAFLDITAAGVRALEVACGPCIGMGATPPSDGNSVRIQPELSPLERHGEGCRTALLALRRSHIATWPAAGDCFDHLVLSQRHFNSCV